MNISTQLKQILCLLLIMLFSVTAHSQELQVYKNGVLQGEFKVKIKPQLVVSPVGLKSTKINGYANTGLQGIDQLNYQYEAVTFERLFPYSPQNEDKHQKHGLHLWYKVKVNTEAELAQVLKNYGDAVEIERVEPFYQKRSLIPESKTIVAKEALSAYAAATTSPYNDPRFDEQWHYHNTESNPGTPGADINLIKAWEKQTGSPNIVVAVIDQGVDVEHEDLAANMWINEAELNGTPGEDSDGNGYIDDVHGFNFVNQSAKIEGLSHGTHVAGTVAAVNNNGIGVSGVAGGSGNEDGVRIMSCQIMSENGFGLPELALIYAADNGAVIAQNSWGYNTPDIYEQAVMDAIDYFIEEAGQFEDSPMQGGVAIFAAGNLGEEGAFYPGCYERVVAVASTGPFNEVTSYSNYGDWIDVTAPGGNVNNGQNYGVLSTFPDNEYGYYDGTSMACPHVSGVAALIASEFQGPDFKNDMLVARLLAGVNVIDTMEINLHRKDKVGLGGVDAYLALQDDKGIAPDAINDLIVQGESEDFILLSWTIPVDEDDDNPRYFEVYYSTENIDETNISEAERIVLNSSLVAGESFSYELNGLIAGTKYFVAVKGVDRWGNVAAISNVVSASTNSGPVLELTPTSFTTSIDVTVDTLAQEQFVIRNSGEGTLKWSLSPRHVENIDIYSNTDAYKLYDLTLNANSASSELKVVPYENSPQIELYAQVEHNDWIYHFDESLMAATAVLIGESKTEIPNSMATHFEVEEGEGFNLTTVELGVGLSAPTDLPIIIEIRKGENIETSELIYVQQKFYDSMPYDMYAIDLDEQIYFTQGEHFWVVVHVPPGQSYPLIASQAKDYEATLHSYISNDLGNSWQLLQDVYYDYTKVWWMSAWSKLEELDTYIKLSPSSGYLEPNSQETIDIAINGADLINGDYKSNIVVFNNDSENELGRIELSFDVTGHQYDLRSVDVVDYNNVFLGETLTKTVTISNYGLGGFKPSGRHIDVKISNPEFTVATLVMPRMIPAQRTISFDIKYSPKTVGSANALVTLTDQDGGEYTFYLSGVGEEPAEAVVSPETLAYDNINLGDTIAGSYYLHNDGNYPLRYYVPKFADGSNMPNFDDRFVHKYGYAAVQIEGDAVNPAFEWVDISETGTDVAESFRINSAQIFHEALLGFDFPYFGSKHDTCYITKWGAVSFSKDGWFNSNPASYINKAQPSKLICAWGMPLELEDGGKILYQQFPGKLIIQYDNVPHGTYFECPECIAGYDWYNVPITFQIVLYTNGTIEFNYKDLNAVPNDRYMGFNRASCLVSIEDKFSDDGLILNGYGSSFGTERKFDHIPTTGHQILIKSPGNGVVETLTNPFGTISVGDSVRMDYTVSTDILSVDQYEELINIISNDPINNPVTHTIQLNITTGGVRNMVFEPEVVDFGDVFQGSVITKKLKVSNTGKAIAQLDTMYLDNANYTVEGYMPAELKVGTFVNYSITLDADQIGAKNDTLTFEDEEGTLYKVPVKANIVDAPNISAEQTKVDVVLNQGEVKDEVININNTGNNPMMVAPVSNEWLTVFPEGITEHSAAVDYDYYIERDPTSEYNNWLNIIETGTKLHFPEEFLEEDSFWVAAPLDINVPFYGEKYNTLYIGRTGVITFTEGQEPRVWGPAAEIPTKGGLDNFLAPLFGFHGFSWLEMYPETGIYVQSFDDKVVVLFKDMFNNFQLGEPVSFQVHMYTSGVIKYLYQFRDDEASETASSSLVGIENQDGTRGVQVMNKSRQFLFTGTVVTFVPYEYYEVGANSSRAFNAQFNAQTLYDGVYSDSLVFKNNTPSDPEFKIPVNLQINGALEYECNDTLELGELVMVEDAESQFPYQNYNFDFTIKNIGSKALQIASVKLKKGFDSKIAYGITMGDDSKFGNGSSEDGWVEISRKLINYKLQPLNNETFRLKVYPLGEGSVNDTVMINCNVEGGAIKIPVSAIFTLPPVVGYPNEGIVVYADNSEHVEARSITINNFAGSSDLEYDIEIAYERESETESAASASAYSLLSTGREAKTIETKAVSQLKAAKAPMFNGDEYNRVLEFDQATYSDQSIGYGGSQAFYAGVGFVAPDDGFNLSHVATWYSWGEKLTSNVEVIIMGGSTDLHEATVLYSQVYEHNATEATAMGEYITIELDQKQLFFPKEKFFVVFKYDVDVEYPQGTTTVSSSAWQRYYFGNGEVYFDLVGQGYSTMGLLIKAAEIEAGSNMWAVLESESAGTIIEGDSLNIDLSFVAKFANQGVNKANFIVRSNDPYNSEVSVPLTLIHNKGPQYKDGNHVKISMFEGDTLQYRLEAYDEEGDTFTLEMMDEYPHTEALIDGGIVDITFTPDYFANGTYKIKVLGKDSNGNSNIFTLEVDVENVNRPPYEAVIFGEQVFPLETEDGYQLQLDYHIIDPDGDELTFEVSYTDESILELYHNGSTAIFMPLQLGYVNITVTATDPMGASYQTTFPAFVEHRVGIDNIEQAAVRLYPNPVDDIVRIQFDNVIAEVDRCELIDASGEVIKVFTIGGKTTEQVFNVSDIKPGVYMLKVHTETSVIVKKLIKK